MTAKLWRQFRECWRADFFSPRGFLLRALLIAAVFLAVHLAGLRDYTSVLNGTVGPGSAGWKLSAFLGLAYLAIYMAFVILAPVLILAAAILALCQRRPNQK
jgi:membrane protein implicated in regulation of membrane protease activity